MKTDQENNQPIKSKVKDTNHLLLLCIYCKATIPKLQLRPLQGYMDICITCSCRPSYKLIPLSQYISLIKSIIHYKKTCINHPMNKERDTLFCLQCHSWFCSFCFIDHSNIFKDHSLLPFEFHLQCKTHQLELEQYCTDCRYDICSKCNESHRFHKRLDNSSITIKDFKQAYAAKIKWLMSQNDELKQKFDTVIANAIEIDISYSSSDDKAKEEIADWKQSINSLYLMNKFINQLLQDFLEALFNTVELFGDHYSHHLNKLASSIQMNYTSIHLNRNNLKEMYLTLKDYYSNCFIVKQYNTHKSNDSILSPFIIHLNGHTSALTALSKFGNNRFASGSQDEVIKLWDSNTFECTNTFKGHSDRVSCIIEFNDNTLISSSWDQTIKVWDINSSACLATLKGHKQYINSVLKLTDDLFVSVAWSTFKVWSISKLQLVTTFEGHSNFVNSMIRVNERTFSTASWDKTVKIWDSTTFRCISTLIEHKDLVYCLVKVNENLLASGSRDKTIKLWDLKTYKCIGTLNGSSAVVCMALLNNYTLVSGTYNGNIFQWDYKTLKADLVTAVSIDNNQSIQCLLKLGHNRLVTDINGMKIITFDK